MADGPGSGACGVWRRCSQARDGDHIVHHNRMEETGVMRFVGHWKKQPCIVVSLHRNALKHTLS